MTFQASCLDPILWPNGERHNIWMIVDAARDGRIFPLLLDCHLNYSCLYSGTLPPALESAAPYLVQLDHDYRDTRRLLQLAWGNSWGIFLRSDTSLEKLRRHLRGFLTVRDPTGSRLVFRYYDPRILRVYLPTCNEEELATVFGPVDRFWTESSNTQNLLDLRLFRGKLIQRTLALNAPLSLSAPEPPSDPERTDAPARRGLLPIRASQMEAFSRREVQKFEDWMHAHLHRFFPQQCQSLTDSQLRDLIHHGIARAAAHGITSERDVCKFVDLMLVFGRDFDTDVKHTWATTILTTSNEMRPKIDRLYEAATNEGVKQIV